jgi:opacity protein-like surface antigen
MKKKFFAACALSVLTLPALANGFYVAGDLGQVKWSADSESETDTAFSFAGGYKLNDTFSFELGYRDLGGVEETFEGETFGADLTATQLSVLASFKINDAISAYGRLGVADMQMKFSYDDGEYSDSVTESKTKAVFGVGGRYAINQKLGLHIEYDRYAKFEEMTVSALLVGFDYQF